MTLTLEIQGQEYNNFLSARVGYSMREGSGTFSFKAASSTPTDFPARVGDTVKVLADGATVLTGFVDAINVRYDKNSHNIAIEGRSRTMDLIDSSLDELNFTAPISLVTVAEKIIDNVFEQEIIPLLLIEKLKVINEVPDLKDFEKGELIAVDAGQNAFDLIEQYCRKRQVLITTNFDGDVVLTRNVENDTGLKLINKIGSPENNIKRAFMSSDISRRFNLYRVRSQTNMSAFNLSGGSTTAEIASNINGQVNDNTIRQSRKIVFVSENAEDDTNALQRATWESNIRRTEGFSYEAAVFGHTNDNDEPWSVNELIRVTDEFADIDALLLIERVDMSFDKEKGSQTDLTMVVQDAYKVQLNEPSNQKKTSSLGDLFSGGGGGF